MSEQHSLVELRLAEPALLLRREEDLDGDVLPAPLALPHLAVPTFAHALDQVDLLRYRPLNLQGGKLKPWFYLQVLRQKAGIVSVVIVATHFLSMVSCC